MTSEIPQQPLELAPVSNSSLTPQLQEKWWWQAGRQLPDWLTHLPERLSQLFNQYRQLITNVALILTAAIALHIVLAVIAALKEIPLVTPTLRLMGVGYSVWFVNRFLLRVSTRQELTQIVREFINKEV